MQDIGQEEHNLSNFVADVLVKNLLSLQHKLDSSDKHEFTTDKMRMDFELQFENEVIDQDIVSNLKGYTESKESENQ